VCICHLFPKQKRRPNSSKNSAALLLKIQPSESSMPQLTPLRQPGQTKPLIWQVENNPYIGLEARAYPANRIPKLNRADSQRVWVIFHQERGSRAKVLGVLAESAPDLYRVICYGEIPCSADDSLDFEWQAGIDTLYTYHQERATALSRLNRIDEIS
jgi:hypothetical protein